MNPHGQAQRIALAAIANACRRQNVPPLDERLKSILARQIRNLLVGGWPIAEIRHEAVELALGYDRVHGHELLTRLQARMERADEERAELAHALWKREEKIPPPAEVLAVISPRLAEREATRRRHPNGHDFAESGTPNSCGVCSGPVGVHVRFQEAT